MRNDECVIYVMNGVGEVLQTYQKENGVWTQRGRNGRVRRMTPEQPLSHLLPPLAGASPARIRVERRLPGPAAQPSTASGPSRLRADAR